MAEAADPRGARPPGAAPLDAGSLDAGPLGAGPLDAGSLDTGPLDTGSPGAGAPGARLPDAAPRGPGTAVPPRGPVPPGDADGAGTARPGTLPARGGRDRLRDGLRAYRLITVMWIRSTMAYRVSFALTLLGNFAATVLDFVAILLMFTQVDALGGYSLAEIALLYGAASTSFGLVDLALGTVDRLGRRVRDGTLDALLVRPAPVLAQVAADRFALRRIGRVTQGLLVLGYGLGAVDVDWDPLAVLMVPLMVLSGAAIFGAVFVAGAAFQFVAKDAAEVQSAFTYGGVTLLQYPPTVFAQELVRGVTFVFPLAFVNWLPALYLLDRPYPLDLPRWLAFAPPLVAVACCALAGLAWRAGLRTYRSTGS
ncbi:ABC-2 family transporter protein [Streptomyces sp. JNUCC 64]